MTAVIYALAVIGLGTVAVMLGLVVLTWAAGRERRGERAARQLGGWR